MRVCLQSLGYDVWKSVKNGYITPERQLYDVGYNKLRDINSKTMNYIMDVLERSEFTKVMHCGTIKEMWDKL
jgi:hypothetical protein